MSNNRIAGVDEAGRGCLAGPVCAAAVILDPDRPIAGLQDSKKLSQKKRKKLEDKIKLSSIAWSVAYSSVGEIDQLNILQASLLAMCRAVEGLEIQPDRVLVDGNQAPDIVYPVEAVIKGDSLHQEISAASILAKQARDAEMIILSAEFPGYGFEKHKGYPTRYHVWALQTFGICDHHRKSFAPVSGFCQNQN